MSNYFVIGKEGPQIVFAVSKFIPFNIVEMDATVQILAGQSKEEIISTKGNEEFLSMKKLLLNGILKADNQLVSFSDDIEFIKNNIDELKNKGIICLVDDSGSASYVEFKDVADVSVNTDEKDLEGAVNTLIKELALKGYLH